MSEIVFASSDPAVSRRTQQDLAAGRLRKLAPRLYTTNLVDDLGAIIRRNLFLIAGHRFPGAVISHRSALNPGLVAKEGRLCITSPAASQMVPYPGGGTIQHFNGHGPVEGDRPFMQTGLLLASTARALLENCQRTRGDKQKTLSSEEIEVWMERTYQLNGGDELNRLRDEAKALAPSLGMDAELGRLDGIFAAALGTSPTKERHSAAGRARAQGLPYDPTRVDAFARAAATLEGMPMPSCADPLADAQPDDASVVHRRFYDAYFSNYIEGTEFEVEEAEQIVFDGLEPAARPKDAHDITASFELLADRSPLPGFGSPGAWLETLKRWHSMLMAGREETMPGKFKVQANRVGLRRFVSPDLVEGTLVKALEMGEGLSDAFARACYLKLVVTEVHPFTDGNGRISRLVLNRLLSDARLAPVIIPNVFRVDYVTALSAFTNNAHVEPLVLALSTAQKFTAGVDFTTLDAARSDMERRKAFASPHEAKLDWRGRGH